MLCLDDLRDGPMRVIWKLIVSFFDPLVPVYCFVGTWTLVMHAATVALASYLRFKCRMWGFWSQSA